MDNKPFYLKGTGKNLISEKLLCKFISNNPELTEHVISNNIELKTLDISYFESFVAWIISQQISGYVAERLINRTKDLLYQINPKTVLSTNTEAFRKIGLSISKIKYIKNIAKFFENELHIKDHSPIPSPKIKQHYCQIKGIGPWTVNMFLIFSLGRMDILPVGDLVVRKGVQILYELSQIPSQKEVKKICQNWNELSTIGTILAWSVMGE